MTWLLEFDQRDSEFTRRVGRRESRWSLSRARKRFGAFDGLPFSCRCVTHIHEYRAALSRVWGKIAKELSIQFPIQISHKDERDDVRSRTARALIPFRRIEFPPCATYWPAHLSDRIILATGNNRGVESESIRSQFRIGQSDTNMITRARARARYHGSKIIIKRFQQCAICSWRSHQALSEHEARKITSASTEEWSAHTI